MAVTTTTMLKYLFAIEKKKHQGLMLVEWGMMIYAAITLVLMLVPQAVSFTTKVTVWLGCGSAST